MYEDRDARRKTLKRKDEELQEEKDALFSMSLRSKRRHLDKDGAGKDEEEKNMNDVDNQRDDRGLSEEESRISEILVFSEPNPGASYKNKSEIAKEYEQSSGGKKEKINGPFIYRGKALGDLTSYIGSTIEIHIPAQYVSNKNEQVINRQFWGTNVYTEDSDVVCILSHQGLYKIEDEEPEGIAGLKFRLRVLPPQPHYLSTKRGSNGIRSRLWGQANQVNSALQPIDCVPIVRKEDVGKKIEDSGRQSDENSKEADLLHNSVNHSSQSSQHSNINSSPPRHGPRKRLKSKALGKKGNKNHKFSNVTFVFNLANEISYKYTLSTVIDRGLDIKMWTSYRLKLQAMFVESHTKRYELTKIGTKKDENGGSLYDSYRWSEVVNSSPLHLDKESLSLCTIPLPLSAVAIIENDLDWNELQWDHTSVIIRGNPYPVLKFFWLNYNNPNSSNSNNNNNTDSINTNSNDTNSMQTIEQSSMLTSPMEKEGNDQRIPVASEG